MNGPSREAKQVCSRGQGMISLIVGCAAAGNDRKSNQLGHRDPLAKASEREENKGEQDRACQEQHKKHNSYVRTLQPNSGIDSASVYVQPRDKILPDHMNPRRRGLLCYFRLPPNQTRHRLTRQRVGTGSWPAVSTLRQFEHRACAHERGAQNGLTPGWVASSVYAREDRSYQLAATAREAVQRRACVLLWVGTLCVARSPNKHGHTRSRESTLS